MGDKDLSPQQNKLAASRGGERDEGPEMSEEDLDALSAFCSEVLLDEISLSAWSAVHRSLDLVVQVRLTPAEALAGGTRSIDFVRTSCQLSPTGGITSRKKERMVQTIHWPAHLAQDGVLILRGEGDRQGDDVGDLKVVLCITPS